MRRAVCPGSFDPPTFGHLDIFSRAARLFDEVTVAVLVNENKHGLFSVDERLSMLSEMVSEFDNVKVASFEGLLVDFCRDNGIHA
ncbi:MAG: adenylyltransferase/cytidyltransferase family protein, partial [Nocardioidaceae bacterium]